MRGHALLFSFFCLLFPFPLACVVVVASAAVGGGRVGPCIRGTLAIGGTFSAFLASLPAQ